MTDFLIGLLLGVFVVTTWPDKFDTNFEKHYILSKSEYNELTQDGKVWAYVRKDTRP